MWNSGRERGSWGTEEDKKVRVGERYLEKNRPKPRERVGVRAISRDKED
jgi:hypothetical protein